MRKGLPWYPRVLPEYETLSEALRGRSISRFGDGELRMALGGNCISQVKSKAIANELKALLRGPTQALVCIPNPLSKTPKFNKTWHNYMQPAYTELMKQRIYGSAFITRPDSAPWINTEKYWARVELLWAEKDVCLVVGTDATSLSEKHMHKAKSLRVIVAPRRDAYAEIDNLEREVGKHRGGPVIICLGATATCLAERLARKGCHALDLGHIGKLAGRGRWIKQDEPVRTDI